MVVAMVGKEGMYMSVANPDKGSNAKARTVEMPLLCSFNGFDAVN